jgi:quercetin dioxygenase-like cupin family protein
VNYGNRPPVAGLRGEGMEPSEAADAESGEKQSKVVDRRGPESRLVAQMIEFPAGAAASTSDSFRNHTGLMYVLEGQLRLDSGGLHEVLQAGDCAYVETDMDLMWSAAGKQRCRILAVFPAPSGSAS